MLQVAAVFSDYMVLQRDKKIKIFGTGNTGSEITVSLLGITMKARCREGRWRVILPAYAAIDEAMMEITDGETSIVFHNIAIGEVWLAGGQSNMELELKDASGGMEILSHEKEENVRFYYTKKMAYIGEGFAEEESKSHWELFDQMAAEKWSATAFFYARKLAEKLNVTVGIIGCNWGGTSASAWMSIDALKEHEATISYVEEYMSHQQGKSKEAQIKEYQEYEKNQIEWDKRAALIYEKEPFMPFEKVQELIGPCNYPGPMNCANFTRPAGLYESMLQRVMPYTLRGFIYYQGESDDCKPNSYYVLLSRLVQEWREGWGEEDLPFIAVQLPMHRYQHEPDLKHWCLIREAQMKVSQTVRNMSLAVAIDCGEFHEIHPKNKKPVGERLALQALCNVYGILSEKEAYGPIYKDFLLRDGGIEITCSHAEEGFFLKGEATGFEVAGEDGIFYPGKAEFFENVIFVSCEEVKEPVMARYLWTNYSEVTVYGSNDLPLAPFRTQLF